MKMRNIAKKNNLKNKKETTKNVHAILSDEEEEKKANENHQQQQKKQRNEKTITISRTEQNKNWYCTSRRFLSPGAITAKSAASLRTLRLRALRCGCLRGSYLGAVQQRMGGDIFQHTGTRPSKLPSQGGSHAQVVPILPAR